MSNVNWQDLLYNLNVNEKSLVFTAVFLGIVAKHISNKVITINEKDAPWVTSEVKTAITRNSRVYSNNSNSNSNSNLFIVDKRYNSIIPKRK